MLFPPMPAQPQIEASYNVRASVAIPQANLDDKRRSSLPSLGPPSCFEHRRASLACVPTSSYQTHDPMMQVQEGNLDDYIALKRPLQFQAIPVMDTKPQFAYVLAPTLRYIRNGPINSRTSHKNRGSRPHAMVGLGYKSNAQFVQPFPLSQRVPSANHHPLLSHVPLHPQEMTEEAQIARAGEEGCEMLLAKLTNLKNELSLMPRTKKPA